MGYSPWGLKESDMTEQLSTAHFVGEREPIQSNWNTHQLSITIKCCDKCFLFKLYAEYIMTNTGLKKHKLESRLPGEILITSYM